MKPSKRTASPAPKSNHPEFVVRAATIAGFFQTSSGKQ
jgi:hypothetical protein